ncbi:MAG TPA: type II toxin-antitoxin system VapC family toxin [Longimicrobiaceae bacterium]|nr:type II toxin-antitoxin system VapC family toxin [Longimicrobiaceae bacterium]
MARVPRRADAAQRLNALFWDASALAKGFTSEPGSDNVLGAFTISRGRGFVSEFVMIEVLTVLAKHYRAGLFSKAGYATAVSEFFRDYPRGFNLVEVDEAVRRRTVGLAQSLKAMSLGALDLLHLSTAVQVQSLVAPHQVVFASADGALLAAARGRGLATYNPERDPLSALVRLLH